MRGTQPWLSGALVVVAACGGSKRDQIQAECDRVVDQIQRAAKGMPDGERPRSDDIAKMRVFCREMAKTDPACFERAKRGDASCLMDLKQRVDTATAQVPAPVRWQEQPVDGGRATARVPVGWERSEFRGDKFEPSRDHDLGFFTEYRIGATCGGQCEALSGEHWAARFTEHELAELERKDGYQRLRDEPIAGGGRLVVARTTFSRPMLNVVAGHWKDGGQSYVVCEATLEAELTGNLDEFVTACRDLKVQDYGPTERF